MSVQVGKRYYFVIHAYHHVIAEVVEITGKREASVRLVSWIYRSTRDWTVFFREGAGSTEGPQPVTTCRLFPDGDITWMAAFEWAHPIPGRERES